MPPEPTEFLRAKYFRGLDGLRALAVLPVVFHHATPRVFPGILGKGAVGVDLFFALSGFLVTTLLLRERRERSALDLPAFYRRRALRIFPLYYATLGAYTLYALWLDASHAERAHFFASLPWHLTYTANWFVDYAAPHPVPFSFSWSLCVEMQFYVFWPLVVSLVRSRRGLALALVLLVLFERGALGAAVGAQFPAGSSGARIFGSLSLPLLTGSLLAVGLDEPRLARALARVLGGELAPPACLAAAIACLSRPSTPYVGLTIALTALVASVVLAPHSGATRLLEKRPFVYVGRISYAIYLSHVTVLGVVRRLFPEEAGSTAFVFLVGAPFVLALAALLHHFVEEPARRAWFRRAPRETGRAPARVDAARPDEPSTGLGRTDDTSAR